MTKESQTQNSSKTELAFDSYFSQMKIVTKGWGYEKWIVNKGEYCGKLLFFHKGKECSWHYHKVKDETFYIQSGTLEVTFGNTDDLKQSYVVTLGKGDRFYIPVGLRHKMKGVTDCEMFEFSTEHFDEDSYRVIKGD
jgi:mannose-6-phosphate isomerase-like protein (cupin superfamily)